MADKSVLWWEQGDGRRENSIYSIPKAYLDLVHRREGVIDFHEAPLHGLALHKDEAVVLEYQKKVVNMVTNSEL